MAMVLQTCRFKQFKRLGIKEHPISEIQGRKDVEGHIHAGFVRIHEAEVLGLEHGAQIAAGGDAVDLADVAGVGFGCRQGYMRFQRVASSSKPRFRGSSRIRLGQRGSAYSK
jgi:hypothetical protein